MATIALYNVKAGKEVEYELHADRNREIVATYEDSVVKFPGGLSKEDFLQLVAEHNNVNKELVVVDLEAEAALDELNQSLLDSL